MKKMITLALVFALALTVISAAASAEGGKWPVRELNGTPVELRTTVFKNAREQSFAGPTRQYALSGAFLSRRVNKATALLREGDAVLVDLEYANSKRFVYFEKDSLTSADVAEEKLEGVEAKTKSAVWPVYYGPGKDYDIVTQRAASRFADWPLSILEELFGGDEAKIRRAQKDAIHWVGLEAGTPVKVFFEANGWLYVEPSSCSIGLARFWIPADAAE